MKLLKRIRALRSSLADNASGLALAERRVAHYKARAKNAENPEHPHPQTLERADRRLHYWRERERKAYLRRHHFRVALKRATKKLAQVEPLVIQTKDGLRVIDGTAEERLHRAFGYARKHWHDRYSEGGSWAWNYALNNAHNQDRRTDCSWWYIVVRFMCGLGKCVSGSILFTGTILEQGREVSQHYAETHCGVAVLFGDPTFHVGMSTGHGPFVIEHGTPTLNTGHFDQFGPGVAVRFRAFADGG